jgi:hypothetical protein
LANWLIGIIGWLALLADWLIGWLANNANNANNANTLNTQLSHNLSS